MRDIADILDRRFLEGRVRVNARHYERASKPYRLGSFRLNNAGIKHMIGLTYDELKALSPCDESFKRVTKLLGGARKWNGKKIDAAQAREAGATLDDIIWAASAVAREDKDVERRLRLWLADRAARVLHIFEKERPTDNRPRNAIIAARQFARGEIGDAAGAARAAARGAAWAAARAAAGADARAAAGAAARAAAGAAKGAAWDAWVVRVVGDVWVAEQAWQFDRLIKRLSDNEPEDYPLPEKPIAQAKAA